VGSLSPVPWSKEIATLSTSLCVILRSRHKVISNKENALMSVKVARELENDTEKLVASEDFPALEEKIYKAIELLKSAREAKAMAERDANRLREQLEQREEEVDLLRSEVVSLRKEREEVRGRVEKMLKQIDQLVAEA
jgi:chromosome segregation ATPase